MEYLKLTAIMKEKNGQLAGIVSLQKINGDVILDWSLGQLNLNDELIFTLQGGKKVQFSSLAKRGKKKVFNVCNEFKCEMVRSGVVIATGTTAKYLQNDMNVINYVNAFANNAKTIVKSFKDEQIEKIGDVFDGKVATYNYYENEFPKCVANDASAIVNCAETKTSIQSKGLRASKADDSAKTEMTKQPSMSKDDIEDSSDQIFGGLPRNEKKSENIILPNESVDSPKSSRPNDKSSKPEKKIDEKNISTDKNSKNPSKTYEEIKCDCGENDLTQIEINDENSDVTEEQNRQDIEDGTDQIFGGLPRNEKKLDETPKKNNAKEEKNSKKKPPQVNDEEKSERDEDELTKKWNEDDATFYESIKEQLDDLFAKFPKDTYLNEIIPSSKWAKVTYDESGRTYSVGILTDGEDVLFVGYGVIAEYTQEPPKELNPNAQWVPLNFAKPHGKGYWMLYQSAKDGTNV